jgi:hypothetical protein
LNRTFRAAGLVIAAAAILALAPAAASANTFASPTSLTFPAQTVGTTSGVPGTVTVTVICSVPGFNPPLCATQGMFVAIPTFTGANPGDFAQSNNCPSGNVLPSGPIQGMTASCTFTVTFKPTAAGSRTALLSLGVDTTGTSPPPISLSGTAVAAPPTGQRAAALAKCKKKHGKKRKKCKNKANQLPV